MKKSSEIIGLPIISIGEGTELGMAKDIIVNPYKGEVAAIVVEDGKWYLGAKILSFDKILGIGEYAITVENSNAVVPITSVPEVEKLLNTNVRIKGTKVLTKGGKMRGEVTEIFIVPQDGKIIGCEVNDSANQTIFIPAEQVMTFGKDVLVIKDSTDEKHAAAPRMAPPATASVPPVTPVPPVAPVSAPSSAPAPAALPVAPVIEPIVQTAPPNAPSVTPPAAQTVMAPPPIAAARETVATSPVLPQKEPDARDELSRKFEEKHRKYVLGKKASRRIQTDNGVIIVEQGSEITEEVIQKAKMAGKFIELTMSIAP